MSEGRQEFRTAPLTVDDLAQMPEDGNRLELVDGRLDVSPAAKSTHTRVQDRLTFHLTNLAPEEFEVQSDTGFNLDATHHRIPDLSVIRAEDFETPYLTRPPVLAVEVLSTESVFRDDHTKRREYAAFGVTSYWIINPLANEPGLLELRLDNGRYREVGQVTGKDVFETDVPFGVRIVPHWLVASGPWKTHLAGD